MPRPGQVLRCIEILKEIRRESRGTQFFFVNPLGSRRLEQRVDLVAALAQGLLRNVGELAPVDGAQRLPSVSGSRNGDGGSGRISGTLNEEVQQTNRNKREIDGEYQVEVELRTPQRSVNSAERSAAGEDIFDHRSERREFRGISDDAGVTRDRSDDVESARQ